MGEKDLKEKITYEQEHQILTNNGGNTNLISQNSSNKWTINKRHESYYFTCVLKELNIVFLFVCIFISRFFSVCLYFYFKVILLIFVCIFLFSCSSLYSFVFVFLWSFSRLIYIGLKERYACSFLSFLNVFFFLFIFTLNLYSCSPVLQIMYVRMHYPSVEIIMSSKCNTNNALQYIEISSNWNELRNPHAITHFWKKLLTRKILPFQFFKINYCLA